MDISDDEESRDIVLKSAVEKRSCINTKPIKPNAGKPPSEDICQTYACHI